MPRPRRGQRTPRSRPPARRPPRPGRRAVPLLLASLLLAPGLAPVAQAEATSLLDPLPERPSPPPVADDVWSYGALRPQGLREPYVQGWDRDDQGRSQEPDFASTQVFGGLTDNCVFQPDPRRAPCLPDTALPPPPGGHSDVLAPGCTDDQGRQPSGLCSLWTTGLGGPRHTLGTPGMSGNDAPGRFSHNKGTVVRFLDAQRLASTGLAQVEVNRKLDDSGVTGSLGGLDPNLGGEALLGPQSLFVWYGLWQDKNGNGVVDEESDPVHNEFTWAGSCGLGGPPVAHPCKAEWTQMLTWVWPNDYGANTRLLPPGLGALTFYGLPGPEGPASLPGFDPAIGGASPDFAVHDFTGASEVARRGWFATPGLPALFTDDSLFATSIVATATFPEGWAPGLPAQGAARDVDLHRSMSPAVSDLYAGTLRPTVPQGWDLLRDTATLAEAMAAETLASTPETAEAWDLAQDTRALAQGGEVLPRLWHEPNTPRDAYPGAVWDPVAPAWDGAGNTYPSSMLWADNHALPLVPVPLTGLYEGSVYLGTDAAPTTSLEGPRQRQAPPGLLGFVARAGKWTDLNGDTWVGQADLRVGLGDDLNDYADTREWQGRCGQTAVARRLAVEPAGMLQGQRWPPAFLVKDYDALLAAPDASLAVPWELVPLEGLEGPVTLRFRAACDDLSTVRSRDALLLPTGALEFDLRVTATFPFQNGPSQPPVAEVRDVDVLAAAASPPYSEPDGNGDGIGDYWEERWEYAVGTINTVGCADVYLDHDGLCLVQEFQWNTIPAYLPALFQGWAPDYDRDDFGDKAESDYWTNWTGEQPLQTLRDALLPAEAAQGQGPGGAWTATPVGLGRRVLSSVANSVVGDYAIAASQLTQSGSQALLNCAGSGGCEADPGPCLAALGALTVDGCIDAVDQATGYALRHPNYPVDLDGDDVFNIHDPDSDGDTLRDGAEFYAYGTYPEWADSDCVLDEPPCRRSDGTGPTSAGAGDSLRDDAEVAYWEGVARILGGRGWDVDVDADGLPSNLLDPDSDGDGLLDGEEVNGVYSPPAGLVRFPLAYRTDSDADELDDYAEVFEHGSDPLDPDTDDDGMPDGWEVRSGMSPRSALGTDGRDSDNDQDGLLNLAEYCYRWAGESCAPWKHGVNGVNPEALRADRNDTDGDKLCDGGGQAVCSLLFPEGGGAGEQAYGTNASAADTDFGGLRDGVEIKYGLDAFDKSDDKGDLDRDALRNDVEIDFQTDLGDWDSDDDEMPDGYEVAYGLDPLDPLDAVGDPTSPGDQDGDLLVNREEYKYGLEAGWSVPEDGVWWNGTSPFHRDTDRDGLPDGTEVSLGVSDPTNRDTDEDALLDAEDPQPDKESIPPHFVQLRALDGDWAAGVRFRATDNLLPLPQNPVKAAALYLVAGTILRVDVAVQQDPGGDYVVEPPEGLGAPWSLNLTLHDAQGNLAEIGIRPVSGPGDTAGAYLTPILGGCILPPEYCTGISAVVGTVVITTTAAEMVIPIALAGAVILVTAYVVDEDGVVQDVIRKVQEREDQQFVSFPRTGPLQSVYINKGEHNSETQTGYGVAHIQAKYPYAEITPEKLGEWVSRSGLVLQVEQGVLFAMEAQVTLGGLQQDCIIRLLVAPERAAPGYWDFLYDPTRGQLNDLDLFCKPSGGAASGVAQVVWFEWQKNRAGSALAGEYPLLKACSAADGRVTPLRLKVVDVESPDTNYQFDGTIPTCLVEEHFWTWFNHPVRQHLNVVAAEIVTRTIRDLRLGPAWYWNNRDPLQGANYQWNPEFLWYSELHWSTGKEDAVTPWSNYFLAPCVFGYDGPVWFEGEPCWKYLLREAELLQRCWTTPTYDAYLPMSLVVGPAGVGAFAEVTPSKERYWLSHLDCPIAPKPPTSGVNALADVRLPHPPMRTFEGSSDVHHAWPALPGLGAFVGARP